VKKGVEVENIVMRGRRPHGILHSMTRGLGRAGGPARHDRSKPL